MRRWLGGTSGLAAVLLLAGSRAILPASAGEPGAHLCSGLAPADTACSLGSHVRKGDPITFDLVGRTGYTGTLEMRFVWGTAANQNDAWRCHFARADLVGSYVFRDCERAGGGNLYKMPDGATYTVTCVSYDYRTTTPGGSGAWACMLVHP